MTTAREETVHLTDLLRREHGALAEFLVALARFDRERRWVELGYSSLFSFLTRELRLSAGAAQYRKTAAELIQRFPEIESALRRGDLCLTSVNEVAKVITAENAAEVLPRFFGKSARDAAFVAAAIRPAPNPPARAFLVTALRSCPGIAVPADLTMGVFRAPEMTSDPEAGASARREDGAEPEITTARLELDAASTASVPSTPSSPGSVPPLEVSPASFGLPCSASASPALAAPAATLAPERPRIRPLDADRARVSMTVSRRLLEKLAAARDALSHSHPRASEEEILELGLDLLIERHRRRRGIGAKPRRPTRAPEAPAATEALLSSSSSSSSSASPPPSPLPADPPPSGRSRHVPAAVWRGVWERDEGRCAWPLEKGGVCGSTHRLQLDHVDGFARGAPTTIDGCRLLCAFHQDVSARALYGDAVMNDFTRPKHGDRCSEPVASHGPA